MTGPNIKIKRVLGNELKEFEPQLKALEANAEYPYGTDTFRIDHGKSYSAFFERLGQPMFHLAMAGTQVVGCAVGVLRTLGTEARRCWYLCDLKVHPDYRRRGIPAQLFRHGLFGNYLKCPRGYAVSMNPPEGPNRVVGILKRFPYVPIAHVADLHVFGLTFDQIQSVLGSVNEIKGPVSFVTLAGKKDLIMTQTGEPMNVLHAQFGPKTADAQSPHAGAIHMMCAPATSQLAALLNKTFDRSASASIVAHGMGRQNWDFVLTSDI